MVIDNGLLPCLGGRLLQRDLKAPLLPRKCPQDIFPRHFRDGWRTGTTSSQSGHFPLLPKVDRGSTFALRRPHSRLLSWSSVSSALSNPRHFRQGLGGRLLTCLVWCQNSQNNRRTSKRTGRVHFTEQDTRLSSWETWWESVKMSPRHFRNRGHYRKPETFSRRSRKDHVSCPRDFWSLPPRLLTCLVSCQISQDNCRTSKRTGLGLRV